MELQRFLSLASSQITHSIHVGLKCLGAKRRKFNVSKKSNSYLRVLPLLLPMLSRFHFVERFLPAIMLQRGTNCFLRTGDDQLLFTSLGHDTQTNQSPVTCRASQAAQAPTDPLYSPPLTAPHPLQTPLTTGDQPQALRLPKDLPGRRVEPPRVAPRPHPVNMKGHLHQRGRPPYTLRDTRWVSVVHEVSSPFNAMHPKPSSVST